MKSSVIALNMGRGMRLRKPEPITRPTEPIALPERRMNPLAVWKRNFVPEQDRMWVHAMRAMQERRAQK